MFEESKDVNAAEAEFLQIFEKAEKKQQKELLIIFLST